MVWWLVFAAHSQGAGAVGFELIPRGFGDAGMEKLDAAPIGLGWKGSWSFDGKEVAFGGTAAGTNEEQKSGIHVLNLASGEVRVLTDFGKDPAWSSTPGGPIAFVGGTYGAGEEIWLVDPDGKNLRKLVRGGFPSWGDDGKTVYFHSRDESHFMKISIEDKAEPVSLFPMTWYYPSVSQDGATVAYRKDNQVLVADSESGETLTSLPIEAGRGFLGGWSPNSRYLCYGGYGRHDVIGLNLADLRTGNVTRLSDGNFTMAEWSRDGKKIVFDYRIPGEQVIGSFETEMLGELVVLSSGKKKPAEVAGEELERWVKDLNSESFPAREKASRRLLEIGSPAVEMLEKIVADENAPVESKTRAHSILRQIRIDGRFGG